jgi:bZIP transcription factor
MENSERGYFNTDHSIGENGFADFFRNTSDSYDVSTSMLPASNSHQDLDNILSSSFMGQHGSGSGMAYTGYSGWDLQGATYSPYPNMSAEGLLLDHHRFGEGMSLSAANSLAQSFPGHNSAELQATSYPGNQSTSHMNGLDVLMGAEATGESNLIERPATKRKTEAEADTTDQTIPKPKKKRGPRKTKEKSAEEKRAKEERKLERNRVAASKCRQKKKVANDHLQVHVSDLETQNSWMKACVEELKQEKNNMLALLLQHKPCNHPGIEAAIEFQVKQIAAEFHDAQQAGTSVLRMEADGQESGDSAASSPSNESQNTSRRNSRSHNSIAMSRSSSSRTTSQKSAGISNPPQSWYTKDTDDMQTYQEMLLQQEPGLKTTYQNNVHSPTSASSPDTSMSRQNSSRSSVSEEHGDNQRNDSGISEMDTPPEERKKNMSGSPVDEAISLMGNDRVLRSRGPHMMMANQRIPNVHRPIQLPAGPSDLQSPSVFLSGLAEGGL